MKKVLCIAAGFLFSALMFAQSRTSFMAHNDEVISVFYDTVSNDGSFFSFSKDGTVSKWDNKNECLQYQITDKKIKLAALNPVKNEIAVYETDENSVNTISVWDWSKLTRKFSVALEDSVLSLTYSKKGTYIIAGSATERGTIFLNSSDGKIAKPITEKMLMTSYVETANSEKSLMSYALTGNIAYYSIGNGKLLKKIETEKGLSKIISFNKNRYIAAEKDKMILIIDAMNGKKVFEIGASNPVFFNFNDELYYFDSSSARSGSLFKFTISESKIENPVIVKNLTGKFSEKITSLLITDDRYILGSGKGNIFCSTTREEPEEITLLSKDTRNKIIDIAFSDSNLLLLTNKTLYLTNEDKDQIEVLCGTANQKNISVMKDKIIFWTQLTDFPVYSYDKNTKLFDKLFTPKGIISSVKTCENNLIEIESNSRINLYDFETNSLQEIYYGTGILDAVLLNENDLYIAKTNSQLNGTSCLYVNTKTHETVPIAIDADHILAITTDSDFTDNSRKEKSDSNIYFLTYSESSGKKAVKVIKLNTTDKKQEILQTITNVDSVDFSSFLYASFGMIYNKISGNIISSVSVKNKKIVSYPRSYSLPFKVNADSENLVTLNYDGSISWYDIFTGEFLADWYITETEKVLEY